MGLWNERFYLLVALLTGWEESGFEWVLLKPSWWSSIVMLLVEESEL